jgi:hypothetical protein
MGFACAQLAAGLVNQMESGGGASASAANAKINWHRTRMPGLVFVLQSISKLYDHCECESRKIHLLDAKTRQHA